MTARTPKAMIAEIGRALKEAPDRGGHTYVVQPISLDGPVRWTVEITVECDERDPQLAYDRIQAAGPFIFNGKPWPDWLTKVRSVPYQAAP